MHYSTHISYYFTPLGSI